MSNNVQIFLHERFGKVRVVMINSEPWFVGKDIALALGYKDHKNALKQHVDAEDKLGWQITTSGQRRKVTLINESGMYALIFGSKLEKAREFKHWVTFEVLPSIRKTGNYSLVDKPAAIRPEEIYRVYVFLLEDGNVKIGRTKRFCERISEIERNTRLSVADIYFTPFMSFDDARSVEQCCKKIFASKHVTGEIFSADFETACATVERFVKLVSVKPIASKRNIATATVTAAEKSE